MTIKTGDKLPSANVQTMGPKGMTTVNTDDIFRGKKVVLFAVPGAFTPTCDKAHLPGFVVQVDAIRAKGVDTVACISVNDAFVMDAWGKSQNAEHILMLADGNGTFTDAIGMGLDCSDWGMGQRCQRYAMVVENGVVTHLAIDEDALEKTSADAILSVL